MPTDLLQEITEPGFGLGLEAALATLPGEANMRGVEGLEGENEALLLFGSQSILDQGEV